MLLPRDQIDVPERQRTDIDSGKLRELQESILARGLLHAPGVRKHGNRYLLVYGERRLRALDAIAEAGHTVRHGEEEAAPGYVPATLFTLETLSDILAAELEENEIREDLSWQDRTRALVAIHEQLAEENFPIQTQRDTAEQIASHGGLDGVRSSGALEKTISRAQVIAPHLDDPAISLARNENEAYQLVLQRQAEAVQTELLRRQQQEAPSDTARIRIILGDNREVIKEIPEGCIDLILTDPPYGIGADKHRDRIMQHHNYEDTSQHALDALRFLLEEGWRVTKPLANIFIFDDIDHFPFFKAQASAMGWTPFRTPLQWIKGKGTEGLAPWGRHGPRRTGEYIFYACKGTRGLVSSPPDNLMYSRVPRTERRFGAEKPVDLLAHLIECATLPGDTVLDPFLGSGSTLVAAKKLDRCGIGIEQSEPTYNTAMSYVFAEEGDLDDDEADGTNGTDESSDLFAPVD